MHFLKLLSRMTRLVLLATLTLFNANGAAQAIDRVETQSRLVVEFDRLPYLVSGLRSDKANWLIADSLPAEVLAAATKAMPAYGFPFAYISHDLNSDGLNEYIVSFSASGSGGTEYAVLAKINDKWKSIGWLQGGFHIAPSNTNRTGQFAPIESWSRRGEIVHTFWKYSKGTYRVAEEIVWPKEFSMHTPPFDVGNETLKKVMPRP